MTLFTVVFKLLNVEEFIKDEDVKLLTVKYELMVLLKELVCKKDGKVVFIELTSVIIELTVVLTSLIPCVFEFTLL
jgi:hypothetical protein